MPVGGSSFKICFFSGSPDSFVSGNSARTSPGALEDLLAGKSEEDPTRSREFAILMIDNLWKHIDETLWISMEKK